MNNNVSVTKEIPRITRGNDFDVRVLVTRAVPSDEGTKQENIDLAKCNCIIARRVTRLGRRITMNCSVDGSYIVIPFEEDVPSGSYGLEVAGKYPNGQDWRFFLKPGEFLDIVEATSDSDTDGATVKDVYDYSAVVLGESLSEAQLTELTNAAANANSAADEASNAATSANENSEKAAEAAAKAEAAATSANDAASKANKAVSSVDSKLTSVNDAEAIRVEAEKERVSAENQRDIHEQQRLQAETNRQSEFNTAKTNAEEAANAANEAVKKVNEITEKERVSLTVSCNHDESITGKKVYIKNSEDGSILETHTWEGKALELSILPKQGYYIECENIEGYNVPKSDTFTSVPGNVREVSLEYCSEWLYSTLLNEDGTDIADGAKFQVYLRSKANIVNYTYTKGMVVKIPFGETYQVQPDTDGGYYFNKSAMREASETEYRESFSLVAIKTGVNIQMVDGTLVSADEWDDTKYSKDNVNGILVFTTGVQCIVYLSTFNSVFGPNGAVDGCDMQTSAAKVKGRLGEKNTAALVAVFGESSQTAAAGCYRIITKKGKHCYLPAYDELANLVANKAAINACSMKVIGKNIIDTSGYTWSSTLYDNTAAWYSDTRGANFSSRGSNNACVPVSAL